MQIVITERHTQVSQAIKDYVHQKASKLLKYYDRIGAIEVVLDGAREQAGVEMIVRVEGTEDFIARHQDGDFFAGVDLVIDKLENQLRRHKEKHRNRKHLAKNPDKAL